MPSRISVAVLSSLWCLACGGGHVPGHDDIPFDPGSRDVTPPDWEVFAAQACLTCESDQDCESGRCVVIGGERRCTYLCPDTTACPPYYLCVYLNEALNHVCFPLSADCSCTGANQGESRECESANQHGTCPGTATCDPQDGWVCDAPVPEEEKCDYEDNDCDGEVDEDFLVGEEIVDDRNCSLCGFSCVDLFENGTGHCTTSGTGSPHCELAFCDPGYQPWEGGCAPVNVLPLCTPCTGTDDCDGGACVLLEGEGGVCTWSCEDKPCPEGYACTDLEEGTYCLPSTGSCECTPDNLGLTRPCSNENSNGICFGTETCTESGFTGCTAPIPLPEDCNGKDDDCDGLVDEDLGTQECTVGACIGEMHCEGIDGWVCEAPEPDPETCDYLDNDCDGIVDNGFINPATGQYDTDGHCGGCGNDCGNLSFPNSYGQCQIADAVASCALVCEPGFVDLNQVETDGCECVFLGEDDPPNGVDENCDGIDGEPDNAVFVASWGSDQNPGTALEPLRSIQKGLDAAIVKSLDHVYVTAGTYQGPVNLAHGKEVYGGFDENFSVHDPYSYDSILIRKDCAQELPGALNVVCTAGGFQAVWSGFIVEGPVCTGPNESSYGVYVRNCGNGLILFDNEIRGGKGGPGEPGAAGDMGMDGTHGKDGQAASDMGAPFCYPAYPTEGGAGGSFQCTDVSVNGGDGGSGACPDFDEQFEPEACPVEALQSPLPSEFGQDGLPAAQGGEGGIPGHDALITTYFYDVFSGECTTPLWACTACQLSGFDSNGAKGIDGTAGPDGSGGNGCAKKLGSVAGGLWQGSPGFPGTDAGFGGGGGGGGAGGGVETALGCSDQGMLGLGFGDYGGSGGGGGSGGCGGVSGTGGLAGGGTFTVFMTWDQPTDGLPVLEKNWIVTGMGGAGGTGGAGGLGGVGGHGGSGGDPGDNESTWCARGGRDGGNGGNGGYGGSGGGGCGGPAIGLYLHGTGGSVPPGYGEADNEFIMAGDGGKGGTGGKVASPGGPTGGAGSDGPHLETNL